MNRNYTVLLQLEITKNLSQFMVYKILIVLLLALIAKSSYASNHYSSCPDADFLALGQRFSSVGFFSRSEGHPPFGSGTLLQTEIPNLKGRLILTAAHVLWEEPSATFCLNGKTSHGKSFIHPEYERIIREHNISFHSHDIALFFLDEPLNETGAYLEENGKETAYKNNLEQHYASVGYGRTGHFFGEYEVFDDKKRGSWAHAKTDRNDTETRETFQENILRPLGSVLRLTPLDDESPLPQGSSAKGDSGGGVFAQAGILVAIISGGTDRKDVHTTTVVTRSSYLRFQTLFDAEHNEALENVKKQQLEGKTSDLNFPAIMADDNVDNFTKRSSELSMEGQVAITVRIAFHKEWLNTLFDQLQKL